MSTTPTSLTFDAFWRWVQEHRNCIVRIGAGEAAVMDNELLHWEFFTEDEGRVVCHALMGKSLVGEIVIDRTEVAVVQGSIDLDNPQSGCWIFECVGGEHDETFPLYHFVLTHGMEGVQGHQALKH